MIMTNASDVCSESLFAWRKSWGPENPDYVLEIKFLPHESHPSFSTVSCSIMFFRKSFHQDQVRRYGEWVFNKKAEKTWPDKSKKEELLTTMVAPFFPQQQNHNISKSLCQSLKQRVQFSKKKFPTKEEKGPIEMPTSPNNKIKIKQKQVFISPVLID